MKRNVLVALAAFSAILSFGQASEEAARKKLLDIAFKYKGVPYMYGAESPRAFDCSGFVRFVYREAFGLDVPRSAREFYSAGKPIDSKTAKPGDVFVYDTVGGAPSHVALVVGDGTVIHAVSAGPTTGVIVSALSDKYWAARLIAARTFIAPAAVPAGGTAPPTATAPSPPSGKPSSAPSGKPASPASGTQAAMPSTGSAVVDIGLGIPGIKAQSTDKIPTAAGTSLAFTLTNETGAGGSFTVLFFRVDPKTYKLQQIHQEKISLASNAAWSLPPYRFDDAGKYRLVVKDSWGNPLLERTFMVTSAE